MSTIFQLFFLSIFLLKGTFAIGCFKCVSKDGDNMNCEDPFHNRSPPNMYQAPCWTGRKDRNGTFPATACTKLHGVYEDGSTIMIRDCALDSGSLTTDTELIRMSHCGAFYLDNYYVRGCVQSCFYDGCNHGSRRTTISTKYFFTSSFLFLATNFWIFE